MQHKNELLYDYIKRFTSTCVDIKDLNESFAFQMFRARVTSEHVHYTLCHKDIITMHKLVTHAQTLVEVEEMRDNHSTQAHPSKPER